MCEINNLARYGAVKVVAAPTGKHIGTSKCVFLVKRTKENTIAKHKVVYRSLKTKTNKLCIAVQNCGSWLYPGKIINTVHHRTNTYNRDTVWTISTPMHQYAPEPLTERLGTRAYKTSATYVKPMRQQLICKVIPTRYYSPHQYGRKDGRGRIPMAASRV